MKSKSLLINLGVICFLYILAIFAGFLAPHNPNFFPADNIPYAPPTQIRFSFQEGLYFHPQSFTTNKSTFLREFQENKDKVCKLSLFVQGSEYKFWNLLATKLHLFGSPNCPNSFHLLGTDVLGRDFLSRLLHGLRPSLFTGVLGVIIAFPLGVLYGTIAGYKSGSAGEIMMRFIEVILSLPTLYLLVVFAAILPPSLSNMQRLFLITAILSLVGWAGLARVVRGQVLSIRKREYVQAAYLIGESDLKIIIREIVPQLSSYLIIALTLSFPSYVLGETALSFLGLGISQPDASLGNILSEGRELSNMFLRPWLAIGPSLVIIVLTWCFNSLGDQLRDIFDPKANLQTNV
ncbi:MAG TPA: ABC transporter permease [Vampirovibrionales bacterium]